MAKYTASSGTVLQEALSGRSQQVELFILLLLLETLMETVVLR